MTDRGNIRDRDQATQIVSFDGMQWGRIYPTNIDGFLEFGDKIFIFIEMKYGESELGTGQRLAFERLVDIVGKTKSAILIIGTHDCPPGKDVDMANCLVTKYRSRKKWFKPKRPITIKRLADIFIEKSK